MAEKRTKLVVEAEGRGLDRVERAAERMNKALDTSKAVRAFKDVERNVGSVTKAVDELARSAGKVDFSKSFKDAASAIAAAEAKLEDFDRLLDAVAAKQRSSASFKKGFWQGTGVGEYFSEDEDMKANIRGRFVGRVAGGAVRGAGRSAWGMASGFGSSAWTGSQGAVQGLSGIPVVGGALAGGLQSALGMSQEYLQLAQAEQDAGSLSRVGSSLRGYSVSTTRGPTDAEQAAASKKELDAFNRDFSVDTMMKSGIAPTAFLRQNPGMKNADETFGDLPRATRRDYYQQQQDKMLPALGKDRTYKAGPVATSSFVDPLSQMTKSGLDFGMNRIESIQFAKGLAESSGGAFQDVNDKAFRTAAAAQGRLGIDPESAGGFMRADRIGGGGGGIEGFKRATMTGMKLGLEGSDLSRYMREMAGTLSNFESTGMPLDVEALGRAQTQLGAAFGANRGNNVAAGLLQAGRGMSQTGPTNATQFQMLQDLYGFKGGGTDEYFDAIQRAEKGEMGDLGGFMEKLTVGGTSQKSKALILMSRMKDLGTSIGTDEAERIAGGDMGFFKKKLDAAAKRTEGFDLEDEAQANVSGSRRRQKGQENTRMNVGGKLISAAQDFEDASINAAKSMSNFDVSIKAFSTLMKNASGDLELLFKFLGDFLNHQVSSGKGP